MDKLQELFGDSLVKYKEPAEEAVPPEGEEEQPKAHTDYFSSLPVSEVLGSENLRYIGVVFSAKYCPPCERLMEPLQKFHEEFSQGQKFELVCVNCDKRELEYKEHLKEMSWCWTLPYNAPDELIARLEERSNASVIPKISIFSVAKGYEKPTVIDIKGCILKNDSMAEAVTQVLAKIQQGEADYDKKDDE